MIIEQKGELRMCSNGTRIMERAHRTIGAIDRNCVSLNMAPASSYCYQTHAELFMPVCGLHEPAGVASSGSLQIHLAGKTAFSSKLHRVCVGSVHHVRLACPILPTNVPCSSFKITAQVTTKVSQRSFLLPSCHGVYRRESAFPLNSGPYGRLQSTFETSDGEAEKDATDDFGGEDAETVERQAVQIGMTPAHAQHWLRNFVPASLWPYAQLARLYRPEPMWLVASPCLCDLVLYRDLSHQNHDNSVPENLHKFKYLHRVSTSFCLAGPLRTIPDLKTMGLLGLWAALMRTEACIVNDIFDKDMDAQVGRTRTRPLPSGAVSVSQACYFLALVFLLAVAVTLPLNVNSRFLAAANLALFAIYALMKRVTYWPQAFLGFTMNWGQLVGWMAIRGSFDLRIILPLYASGTLWVMIFDTIYAYQDRKDDLKAGIKSTAVLFGDQTRILLSAFSVAAVALLALAGLRCGLGWPFYAGVAAAAGHLTWQISTAKLDDATDCCAKLLSNVWYGAIVLVGIILGNLVPLLG